MPELLVGTISDYFARVGVAGIELTGTLKVGDVIHIKGHTTDVQQPVASMEIDRQPVPQATAGQSIGVRVQERVRRGDQVYKVMD
ncbi:MAG: translation elongation factor-like protein [Chloroflexi bacterium]|nr:translation elongation factor-like protein [Chloroflexota bacterium]